MTQTLLSDIEMDKRRACSGVFVSGNKRDYGGATDRMGKIMGSENLVEAFGSALYNIGFAAGRKDNSSLDIFNSVMEYKAISFCCDINTSTCDKELNDYLCVAVSPEGAREYKLIN